MSSVGDQPVAHNKDKSIAKIGDHLHRKEDIRLITGKGEFADDLRLVQPLYVVFARSPYAHALISHIDIEAAQQHPGVHAVLTGESLADAGIRPIRHNTGSSKTGSDIGLTNRDGSERRLTPHFPLPIDRVRFVGEAYAAVVAESIDIAKDALELIDTEWEALTSVTDAITAISDTAPKLWDILPNNISLEADIGNQADTEAAFASSTHIVSLETRVHRVTGAHMEPRAASAEFDAQTGRYTLHASCGAGVVQMRDQMAESLGIEPENIRVVAPRDVGGNFGTRNTTYPEFVVIAHAAQITGHPVKHVGERTECLISDFQGRDLHINAELAIDSDGHFLAVRSTNTSNQGAYTASFTPLNKGVQLMTSLYKVPAATVTARGVTTNTPSTIPYRSAGRPEAMYAVEVIIDKAARQLGIDRIELRRRNIMRDDDHLNPFGIEYDNGDYLGVMEKTLKLAEWDSFEERRKESLQRGKYRGIGFGNYIETAGGIPRERAEITIDPATQMVDVIIGTQNTGQGHETAFAQLVGALMGISHEMVTIRASDTDFVKAGGGSHSGRSLRFASIVFNAATNGLIQRCSQIVAAIAGTTADKVEFEDGVFKASGSNIAMSWFDVANEAQNNNDLPQELRGDLREISDITTPGLSYPYGSAVCELEIDPETGKWEILRYTSIDDVGRVLNPMIVHGQTHGGIVQGAGQALMEWCRYSDDNGQPLAGSFMDYNMPRADDFPSFITDISEVPSNRHPLGFRPGGEGGTTPALATTTNAIADALSPLGVDHVEMPFSPLRVWEAIQTAQSRI